MKSLKKFVNESYALSRAEVTVNGYEFNLPEAITVLENPSSWYDIFQVEEDMYEWQKIEDIEHEIEDLEEEKEDMIEKMASPDLSEEEKQGAMERIAEIEDTIVALYRKREKIDEDYVEKCAEMLREAVEEVVEEFRQEKYAELLDKIEEIEERISKNDDQNEALKEKLNDLMAELKDYE